MTRTKTMLALALSLLMPVSSFAQQAPSIPVPREHAPAANTSKSEVRSNDSAPTNEESLAAQGKSDSLLQEVTLLQRQLEYTTKFQSDVLATVYWSLGAIVGVFLLLMGFNWFSNFKVYERDKAAMMGKLRTLLKSEITAASQIQQASTLDERARSQDALANLSAEMRARTDQRLADQQSHIESLLSSNKQEILAKIESVSDSARKSDTRLDIHLSGVRARIEAVDDNWSMVITHLIRRLESVLDLEYNFLVNGNLRSLLEAIEKGGKFTEGEAESMPGILARIPSDFSELRDKLSEKIQGAIGDF